MHLTSDNKVVTNMRLTNTERKYRENGKNTMSHQNLQLNTLLKMIVKMIYKNHQPSSHGGHGKEQNILLRRGSP